MLRTDLLWEILFARNRRILSSLVAAKAIEGEAASLVVFLVAAEDTISVCACV